MAYITVNVPADRIGFPERTWAFMRKLHETLRELAYSQKTHSQLTELSDRYLRDVGLTRRDAECIAHSVGGSEGAATAIYLRSCNW